MRTQFRLFVAFVLFALATVVWAGTTPPDISAKDLPPEARHTLHLIRSGGPFSYRQDGAVFGNREHRLPAQDRGYYREYTVPTPGARDRGARRVIAAGQDPRNPAESWYTEDHYRSFRRIRE